MSQWLLLVGKPSIARQLEQSRRRRGEDGEEDMGPAEMSGNGAFCLLTSDHIISDDNFQSRHERVRT